MRSIRTVTFILALILCHSAQAQFEGQVYQQSTAIPVYVNGQERTISWAGGFNNPQMAMADLNNDNKLDLVIYERFNKQVKTFINYGTAGNPDYRYEPVYTLNFPEVSEYLILADYNNDGIEDLFERGIPGFQVYKGFYNANNELCFSFYRYLSYSNDSLSAGEINAYVDPSDIPIVYDVDGDSDLDLISFWSGGSRLYFYQNMRVEDGLPADSIRLKLRDRCWGQVFQGFDKPYILNDPCNNGGLGRSSGAGHTGNTLCMLDIDGDGDNDILNGNLSFSDIQLLVNGKAQGTSGLDYIISQDTTWKGYSRPQWPSVFGLDIDQDGNKDVLVTPHGEGISENYKTITLFRNTGTNNAPMFTYQSDTFLVSETMDFGTASRPLFYDYDKDGKPDLLVGSDGYFQNGVLRSRLSYYRNTSTPGNPSFEFQADDLLGFSSLSLKGSSPAIGDLDGDGKDDLVLGQADGTLTFYSNSAVSNNVQPIWSNPQTQVQDEDGFSIDVGQAAAPVIYDIDLDGKPDLLIGTMVGYLVFYKNVNTTPGQLKLQFASASLGDVKADPQTFYVGNCTPYIGKMDNTNNTYIVTGSTSGRIYRFTGFQGGDTSITYPMTDSVYSWISGAGIRTAPAIADVDGDGMYEMLLGNQYGGLFLFKQWVNASASNTGSSFQTLNVKIFPNPARDELNISWKGASIEKADIRLFDALGRVVRTLSVKGQSHCSIAVSELPEGVYFCEFNSRDGRIAQTVSISR